MPLEYVSDPFERPELPIVGFIQATCGFRRKLTPGQVSKLQRAVQQEHSYPSPAHLFETDPLFKEWIRGIIAWADGSSDGKRKPTQALVSAIRNYERPDTGWLEFKQRKEEALDRPARRPEDASRGTPETTEASYLEQLGRKLGEGTAA